MSSVVGVGFAAVVVQLHEHWKDVMLIQSTNDVTIYVSISFRRTGSILAVPVPHHAITLEWAPSSLVTAANPFDAFIFVIF